MPQRLIGIFDSGVGGLSVLRHIRAQLPHEPLLYVADQAHVPYGSRSVDEIRDFSLAVTRFLLAQNAKLIVVACNTATGAALTHLRQVVPGVPFVGVEPAVKPAAAGTRSGKIGVLATAGTFESQRYHDLMARFASNVELYQDPCAGLVELIEAGAIQRLETRQLLQRCLGPMLDAGIDVIVLGCTHYPFVIPLIEEIADGAATIVDPAPAVALQTGRLLRQHSILSRGQGSGEVRALTTGDPHRFSKLAKSLLDFPMSVTGAEWRGSHLHPA